MGSNSTEPRLDAGKILLIAAFVMIMAFVLMNLLDLKGEMDIHENRKLVYSDLRSMASALESYYIEQYDYPDMIPLSAANAASQSHKDQWGDRMFIIAPGYDKIDPTLDAMRFGDAFLSHQEPLIYYRTPFDENPENSPYVADIKRMNGFILLSAGPDKDYDLTSFSLVDAFYHDVATSPSSREIWINQESNPHYDRLKMAFWDPTNGSSSSGDIIYFKRID